MKEFTTRRVFPRVGDVWVQFNPGNQRYRWRCPRLAQFSDWSYSEFRTVNDAFEAAELAMNRSPHMYERKVP